MYYKNKSSPYLLKKKKKKKKTYAVSHGIEHVVSNRVAYGDERTSMIKAEILPKTPRSVGS